MLLTDELTIMPRNSKGNRSGGSVILGHLGALLTVSMWGYSFVSSKVLLEHGMGPTEIYVCRFILAYLLIAIASHSRLFSNSFRDEVLFFLCGLCAGSIYFIAENTALEYTLTTNVSLLTSMSPLITAMLVGLVYKNEKLGSGIWIGSAFAVIGVGCVVFNSSADVQIRPLGDFLSLAAAFSWADHGGGPGLRGHRSEYPFLLRRRGADSGPCPEASLLAFRRSRIGDDISLR